MSPGIGATDRPGDALRAVAGPHRRRWALAALLVLVVLVAGAILALTLASASEPRSRMSAPQPLHVAPAPDAAIPTDPSRLAERLTAADAGARAAIARWRAEGDPSRGVPPDDVTLQTLYLQRALRMLARNPTLARRTIARLRPRPARMATNVVEALRSLRRLSGGGSGGGKAPRVRTAAPEPVDALIEYYGAAQRRFGVGTHVLAAVNMIETAFGRVRNASSAGAQGPMQFIGSTWKAYGLGGDVRDPRDAILGAANYLRASGAPRDYARALYHYNPSRLYVDAIRRLARVIARDRTALTIFYSWQVYVGDGRGGAKRITGPGT